VNQLEELEEWVLDREVTELKSVWNPDLEGMALELVVTAPAFAACWHGTQTISMIMGAPHRQNDPEFGAKPMQVRRSAVQSQEGVNIVFM